MKKIIILFVSLFLINSATMIQAQETEPIAEQKVQKTELSKAENDSLLYEKLNAEQIMELKRHEKELELKRRDKEAEVAIQKIQASMRNEMPLTNFSIIMICLLPFAFVIIIVYLNVRKKNAESRQRYELYMKSLEMGQNIPEHFFDQPKQNEKASNLKRGIILLMLGIAFGVFAIIDSNTNMFILLAAIIPTFVGVAYLLIHKLEKPALEDKKDEQI